MSGLLATRFTERFGCDHPVVMAGMAFAGELPPLCVAVTQAGGVGSIGVGLMSGQQLQATIRAVRDQVGERPFHVNLIACFDYGASLRICAEEAVPIVSFHWGHPDTTQLDALHDAGCSVWEQVGTVDDARRAHGDGVDAVIAQGWEAGGHNYGGLPTFVLLPAMRDALSADALLLAAGGVSDGRGLAAALCLGADGVWVGTRLAASAEANVHPEHHRGLVAARGEDTLRTAIFGPELPHFNPARVLRNEVVDEFTDRLADVPVDRSAEPEIGRTLLNGQEYVKRRFDFLLPTPDTTGDFEQMAWLMGQGVGAVGSIEPAADIVSAMVADAHAILMRTGSGSDA